MSIKSKAVDVLWLSQEDCIKAGALDAGATVSEVEKVNRWVARGQITETPLMHLLWEHDKPAGRRIGVHATLITSDEVRVAAVKGIPSNPSNPLTIGMPRSNGLIILYNEDTGFPFAVMDDTIVSAMRTGASSVVGAKYLAHPNASVLGLIGCGVIQTTHLLATQAEFGDRIKHVNVFDTDRARAERFVERHGDSGYPFEIHEDARSTISESDIVYTCTNVNPDEAYIHADWIKPGSFHSAVSMWDYTNATILRAFTRYAMDYKERLKDAGFSPLSQLTATNQLSDASILELGDVIEGKADARERENDSVYFATLGICANDAANSYRIYRRALELDIGTKVQQWNEPAMF